MQSVIKPYPNTSTRVRRKKALGEAHELPYELRQGTSYFYFTPLPHILPYLAFTRHPLNSPPSLDTTRNEMSFTSIPILDLSLARDPSTKPAFLSSLQHALLEVGFLYIRNTGIPEDLVRQVIAEGKAFFELPEAKKLEVQMKNAASFLGTVP